MSVLKSYGAQIETALAANTSSTYQQIWALEHIVMFVHKQSKSRRLLRLKNMLLITGQLLLLFTPRICNEHWMDM